MQKIILGAVAAVTLWGSIGNAQAATIVNFTFDGPSNTFTTNAKNYASPGISSLPVLSSTGSTVTSVAGANGLAAQVIGNNRGVQFGLSVTPEWELALTGFTGNVLWTDKGTTSLSIGGTSVATYSTMPAGWSTSGVSSTFSRTGLTGNVNVTLQSAGSAKNLAVDNLTLTGTLVKLNNTAIAPSASSVNFGRVLRGATAGQTLTLNKVGSDDTTYAVSRSGAATAGSTGGSFAGGTASATLPVGLDTAAVGNRSGSVTVANTASATAVRSSGANKGTANVSAIAVSGEVVDGSRASFAADAVGTTLTVDLGTITEGTGSATAAFNLYNLLAASGWTAGLDLDSITVQSTGSEIDGTAAGSLRSTLATFANLAGGQGRSFNATLMDNTVGSFSEVYQLGFSDANDVLGGSASGSSLMTLEFVGTVTAVPEPSAALRGGAGLGLLGLRRRRRA